MTKEKANIPPHITMESALGAAVLLATKAPTHKYLFAHDFEWLVVPAIATKQFSLFRNKQGEPIAFVSWAKVNEDVENRLQSGIMRLSPADWNCGEKTYIIDIISPFTPTTNILKQLAKGQFKDKEVSILRPNQDQTAMEAISLNQAISEMQSNGEQEASEAVN